MNKYIVNTTILIISLDVLLNDLNFWQTPQLVYLIAATAFIMIINFPSKILKNKKIARYNILPLICFFSIIFFVILLNYNLKGNFQFNFPIVVKYFLYLMIGINWNKINYKTLILSIVIILVGFLRLFNFSTYSIDFDLLYDPTERYVMASASDTLVVLLLLLRANRQFSRKNVFIAAIFVVSFLAVFFSGSRTTLLLFTTSVLLIYGIKLKYIGLLLIVLWFLLSDFLIEYLSSIDSLSQYRIMKLINYSDDVSVNARKNLWRSGIYDISIHPVSGKFGGQLTSSITDNKGARWGAYIHNIFSYYRQFGLLAFLLFVGLFIEAANNLLRYKRMIPILFFLTIAIVFSRSYTYAFVFLLFGISINYSSNLRKIKK